MIKIISNKEKFWDYYYKYLGIENETLNRNQFIFESIQRDKPINTWYLQHLIAANINGNVIFSISPTYFKAFEEYMVLYKPESLEKLKITLNEFFSQRIESFGIRNMYRLTREDFDYKTSKENFVQKLTKDILMNSLREKNLEEQNKVWNRKKKEVEEGRQYVILHNEKIVSYCKISDIDYCGGNLTVWTAPEYRNKGYGKKVVKEAVKWCFENGIVPIYWVDSTNIASLNLSKSLGFKIYIEELVVSTTLDQKEIT